MLSRAWRAARPFLAVDHTLVRPCSARAVELRTNDDAEISCASKSPISLRDYQSDAIQSCLDAFDEGLSRIGVSSPTGSGKTTVFMHLIPAVRERAQHPAGSGKTLILVSGIELASQTESAARRMLGSDWTVEVEQGSRVASGKADV